ncbi:hypothetical protein [Sphingomonas montanisoli]|uniref:hypothetical protein n=1 Tax=Sphingomonas montanisoli TaxID=2606412 RepID=UPI0015E175A4|nr:hypothetical protein [Sphingomonas montanisoli]
MIITVQLSLRPRWWLRPALFALTFACVVASFISFEVADRVSDIGTGLLARHGFIVRAR